jgi:hypothetical protein
MAIELQTVGLRAPKSHGDSGLIRFLIEFYDIHQTVGAHGVEFLPIETGIGERNSRPMGLSTYKGDRPDRAEVAWRKRFDKNYGRCSMPSTNLSIL